MLDDSTLKAIKSCIVGITTKEIVTEYVFDEATNGLKISKQKVLEKTIPPNVDVIKLLYQHRENNESKFDSLTDDELEKEKQRLLKLLKEEENGRRKNIGKTKM